LQVIDDRIEQRKGEQCTDGRSANVGSIYSSSNRRIRAFLDMLLEEFDQENISKEGVREEVDTFMFEVRFPTTSQCIVRIERKNSSTFPLFVVLR
jgi:hypothetical protein